MSLFGKKFRDLGKFQSCPCGVKTEEHLEKRPEQKTAEKEQSEKHVVKVLGLGCPFCKKMYGNVLKAAETMKPLELEVQYCTDPKEFMPYGALSMPGMVVDEKLVSSGKVLSADAAKGLILKALGL